MSFQLILRKILSRRFNRWLNTAYAYATQLRWDTIGILSAGHFAISYTLLYWADESRLLPFNTYWYFYITTATTVGYGDLTPQSAAGRYVVTLLIMPGGIILFTTIIAKLVQDVTDAWKKRMKGLKDYPDLSGHIIVIGWCEQRTSHMIELIRADASERRDIILVANVEENPHPQTMHFVRAANLSSPEAMQRASISQASLVIVLAQDDNETLTAALAAGAVYQGHLVAYFEQAGYADLLNKHCLNAEPVISLSIESTVRTAQDPGSSHLITQLLSNLEGQTQYRLTVPTRQHKMLYGQLFTLFKKEHDATLLGISHDKDKIQLNPPSDAAVLPGMSLYFMAAKRLRPEQINWPEV